MRTHLQILQIMSFVLAGLNFIWGLFFCLYFGLFTFATGSGGGGGPPMPVAIFMVIFGLMGLLVMTNAVLNLMSGLNYPKLQRRNILIASAVVNCIPFISCMYVLGIPVGIYALVVLFGTEGKTAFERAARGEPPAKILRDPRRGRSAGSRPWEGNDDDVDVADGGWDEGKK